MIAFVGRLMSKISGRSSVIIEDFLILEDGFYFLQEDGVSKFELE